MGSVSNGLNNVSWFGEHMEPVVGELVALWNASKTADDLGPSHAEFVAELAELLGPSRLEVGFCELRALDVG